MLILTRKISESIRIGDSIIIKVIELDNRHVKIGIEAPRTISVYREEVFERIQKENQAASDHPHGENIRNIADMIRKNKL